MDPNSTDQILRFFSAKRFFINMISNEVLFHRRIFADLSDENYENGKTKRQFCLFFIAFVYNSTKTRYSLLFHALLPLLKELYQRWRRIYQKLIRFLYLGKNYSVFFQKNLIFSN